MFWFIFVPIKSFSQFSLLLSFSTCSDTSQPPRRHGDLQNGWLWQSSVCVSVGLLLKTNDEISYIPPAFLKLQLCDKSLAQGKNLYVCASFTLCHYVCVCVLCCICGCWRDFGCTQQSLSVCCSALCILFSLLVWMCMLFLCVCVCKPLSRGSSAAVLLIGLTGLGLVTIVTAICFDYPFASTQKTLHTHIHTQAHTNAKQTKTICPGTFALLSKSYTSFFSSSFNCLILSCDRVCRPPVFRANKRGCFPLCCSSPLLLFFFGLCSGVVKIRCPLPWLSCGDMCS